MADNELPMILTAAEEQGIKVAWVAVRPGLYEETPIATFQALNDPSRPLAPIKNLDREYVALAKKISSLAGQAY